MAAFLSHGPIDPAALLSTVEAENAGAGAVASFTGLARGIGKDGAAIDALVLQSYRGVTLASMQGHRRRCSRPICPTPFAHHPSQRAGIARGTDRLCRRRRAATAPMRLTPSPI